MDSRRLRAALITADHRRVEMFHPRLVEEAGFKFLCALEPRPGIPRWSAQLARTRPAFIQLDATSQPPALKVLPPFQSIGSHRPMIVFADLLSP